MSASSQYAKDALSLIEKANVKELIARSDKVSMRLVSASGKGVQSHSISRRNLSRKSVDGGGNSVSLGSLLIDPGVDPANVLTVGTLPIPSTDRGASLNFFCHFSFIYRRLDDFLGDVHRLYKDEVVHFSFDVAPDLVPSLDLANVRKMSREYGQWSINGFYTQTQFHSLSLFLMK